MQELAAYFFESVFLPYKRYVKIKNNHVMGNNKDRREAINAAIALYHLREHIPFPHQKSWADVTKLCPDYALLGDIVNAAKHKVLNRGTPRVVRDESIYEVLVCTEYEDEAGVYNHEEKVVEVELVDGSTRNVYEILTNVLNFWYDELHRIGAIESRQPVRLEPQGLILRKDASHVGLVATRGLRYKQQFEFRKYNYKTNQIEPRDLSGASYFTFTARKPPTFEIRMIDGSGFQITKELLLTHEQFKEMEKYTDPTHQQQYVLRIAESQGILPQMVAEYQARQRQIDNSPHTG